MCTPFSSKHHPSSPQFLTFTTHCPLPTVPSPLQPHRSRPQGTPVHHKSFPDASSVVLRLLQLRLSHQSNDWPSPHPPFSSLGLPRFTATQTSVATCTAGRPVPLTKVTSDPESHPLTITSPLRALPLYPFLSSSPPSRRSSSFPKRTPSELPSAAFSGQVCRARGSSFFFLVNLHCLLRRLALELRHALRSSCC